MFIISDRVKETSTTSGSGSILLNGAYGAFQTFLDGIGDGSTTYYTIENNTRWEVGQGTYDAATNSLSRDIIFNSSQSDQKINLQGTSIVFCTLPAEKAFIKDPNSSVSANDIVSSGQANLSSITTNSIYVSGDSNLSVIDSGGKVGILTDSPIYDLDVNGSGRLESIYLTSGIYFQDGTFQSTAQDGGVTVQDVEAVSGIAVYASGLAGTGGGDVTTEQLQYVSGIAVYASGLSDQNAVDILTVSGIVGDSDVAIFASGLAVQNEIDIATVSGLLYDDTAISGYFESRADTNENQIIAVSGWAGSYADAGDAAVSGWADSTMDTRDAAVSGWAQAYVDSQDHSATAVSGWAGSYADAGDAAVSGWADSTMTSRDNAVSGWAGSYADAGDAAVSGWADNTFNLQEVTDRGSNTTNSIFTSGNITATSGYFDTFDMTLLGNSSQPPHLEGRLFYDSDNHTLSLYNDEADVTLQLGQEEFLRVRNNTGATITNGTAVLITGAHGNAAPTISGAIATSEANSQVIGLATHDIEDSSFGYVTTYGIVRDVDTSEFSDGDEVFLSATQVGSGVNVSPTIPNYKVTVGHIIRSHHSNGSILVQIGNPKLGGGDLKSEAALNMSGVPFVTSISDTTAGGSQTDPLFVFDSGNRQLQVGSGIQLLDGVPSNTSNVLYNDAGSLYFNGSGIGGGGDSYTAGSGLTLDGTEFNVYGGSGHFIDLKLETSGTGDLLTLTSTEDGSDAAPVISTMRDSASPANGDYLGQLKFKGRSDTGTERVYAKITGKTLSVTNGDEDGLIEFAVRADGSQEIISRIRKDGWRILNDNNLYIQDNGSLGVRVDPTYSLHVKDDAYIGSGVTLPDVAPAVTTNKLYNVGGSLYFNGSGVSGGGGGASYTAGSGLTLDGTEFNVYGGSGHFVNLVIENDVASDVPVTVTAAAAQSANLQEWQPSLGTVNAHITANGEFSNNENGTTDSEVFGAGATANGRTSCTIIGKNASATGSSGGNAIAIGDGASAAGSTTSNGRTIAIGGTASAKDSVAIGGTAASIGNVAVGYGTSTTGLYASVAVGYLANDGGFGNNVVIGGRSTATAANQFVCGRTNATQGILITDVFFGNGVTNATPQDYTYNGTGGNGTDIGGGDISLAGGKGTGAGVGGSVNVKVADPGVTGSSLNGLRTIAYFATTGVYINDSSEQEALRVQDDGKVIITKPGTTSSKTPQEQFRVVDSTANSYGCVIAIENTQGNDAATRISAKQDGGGFKLSNNIYHAVSTIHDYTSRWGVEIDAGNAATGPGSSLSIHAKPNGTSTYSEGIKVDWTDTAGLTRLHVYDVDSSGLQRVTNNGSLLQLNGVDVGVELDSSSSAATPLIVRGAASQSANLQEWQDSSEVVKASIEGNGSINGRSINVIYNLGIRWKFGTNTVGYITVDSSTMQFFNGSTRAFGILVTGPVVGNGQSLLFSSSSTPNAFTTQDLSISRAEAGVLRVSRHNTGQLGDIMVSGVIASGHVQLGENTPSDTTDKLYNVGGSLYFNGSEVASNSLKKRSIQFVSDGGGSVLTTGVKSYITVPYDCTVQSWTILAENSGSVVVDVWKDTYANYPPTVADTITGSEKPTISSGIKNQDNSLTTWTTALSEGDILAFNIDSVTDITKISLSINVEVI